MRQLQVLARLGALGLDDADRLAQRVLDQPAVAVLAVQGAPRTAARCRPGPSCRCRPRRAAGRPARPAGRSGAARRPCRCPRSRARRPSRPSPGRACGAGRRSRFLRSPSSGSSSPRSAPDERGSFAATPRGSLIRNGLAKTVTASSETASSTPWRSVIVPRRAGTSRSSTCWVDGALLEQLGPHGAEPGGAQRWRAPRSRRKSAKRRPIRRSSSRTGLPRRGRQRPSPVGRVSGRRRSAGGSVRRGGRARASAHRRGGSERGRRRRLTGAASVSPPRPRDRLGPVARRPRAVRRRARRRRGSSAGSAPRPGAGRTSPRSAATCWIRSLEPSRATSARRPAFSRFSAAARSASRRSRGSSAAGRR